MPISRKKKDAFYSKPTPEVGSITNHNKSREPKKRSHKGPPVTKPSAAGIENLNLASIAEITRQLEKEIRRNGPYTNDARILRAALNKANEVEGIKDPTELNLIQEAATKRWPMLPSDKRLIVKKTLKHVKNDDPVISIRGIRAAILLEKMNQADEHHEEGELVTKVTVNADQTLDERRSRLAAIAKRRGLGRIVIDVPGKPAGGNSETANGSSSSAGKSNGHAGGLRSVHQQRPVEDSETSGNFEPGTNGHSNGKKSPPDS